MLRIQQRYALKLHSRYESIEQHAKIFDFLNGIVFYLLVEMPAASFENKKITICEQCD